MVFNLFDWLLVASTLAVVLNGCQRGLGREGLHTFLLMMGIAGGVLFLKDGGVEPQETEAVVTRFANFGLYLVMLYIVLWAVIRFIGPVLMDGMPQGYRSRFWAGIVALVKLICLAVGFNLAYAIATPLPAGERLQALPVAVADSVIVNTLDRETERVYGWLYRHGWVADKAGDMADGTATEAQPAEVVGEARSIEELVPPSPTQNLR